jgi:hypothetical protein
MGACGLPMFGIVPVVTSLAECSKILRITILGSMVEMSDGENYLDRFGELPVLCACLGHITIILNPTELTTVVSSLQDLHSYILPIRRISFLVFWSYRHRLFECGNQRVSELPLILDNFNSSFQIGEFI